MPPKSNEGRKRQEPPPRIERPDKDSDRSASPQRDSSAPGSSVSVPRHRDKLPVSRPPHPAPSRNAAYAPPPNLTQAQDEARPWSEDEDKRLNILAEEHARDWPLIAAQMAFRTAAECKRRYEIIRGRDGQETAASGKAATRTDNEKPSTGSKRKQRREWYDADTDELTSLVKNTEMNWREIGLRMGRGDACKNKWYHMHPGKTLEDIRKERK